MLTLYAKSVYIAAQLKFVQNSKIKGLKQKRIMVATFRKLLPETVLMTVVGLIADLAICVLTLIPTCRMSDVNEITHVVCPDRLALFGFV